MERMWTIEEEEEKQSMNGQVKSKPREI